MLKERKALINSLAENNGLKIKDEALPYFDAIPEYMLAAAINGTTEWARAHHRFTIGEEEIVKVIDIRKASRKAICVANSGTKENGFLTFGDKNSQSGLVFYPGGKVEWIAYAPLVKAISELGIFTVLVEFPWNLAFYDNGIADKVLQAYPGIKNWYIAGHSLGGAEAANYLSGKKNNIKGIIFLGAYPKLQLDIPSLSIYGTNDTVVNKDNYNNFLKYHTTDFTEHVIEGGNHALFGNYGKQVGDSDPTITANKQQSLTVKYIDEFIKKEGKH